MEESRGKTDFLDLVWHFSFENNLTLFAIGYRMLKLHLGIVTLLTHCLILQTFSTKSLKRPKIDFIDLMSFLFQVSVPNPVFATLSVS